MLTTIKNTLSDNSAIILTIAIVVALFVGVIATGRGFLPSI